MFTHLLDPQPTEAHVFVSLYAQWPLTMIATESKSMRCVNEGKIEFHSTLP